MCWRPCLPWTCFQQQRRDDIFVITVCQVNVFGSGVHRRTAESPDWPKPNRGGSSQLEVGSRLTGRWCLSIFFFSACCTDSGFIQVCRIAFAYGWKGGGWKGWCVCSCDLSIWKKYYPSSASGTPLHICLTAMWLIILGIPIQGYPQEAKGPTRASVCFKCPPPSPLLFFTRSPAGNGALYWTRQTI